MGILQINDEFDMKTWRDQTAVMGVPMKLGETRGGEDPQIFAIKLDREIPHLTLKNFTKESMADFLYPIMTEIGVTNKDNVHVDVISADDSFIPPRFSGSVCKDEASSISVLEHWLSVLKFRSTEFQSLGIPTIEDYNHKVSREKRMARAVLIIPTPDFIPNPLVVMDQVRLIMTLGRSVGMHVILGYYGDDSIGSLGHEIVATQEGEATYRSYLGEVDFTYGEFIDIWEVEDSNHF